eukprot:6023872-Prymnesium_polylepis.1
MSQWRWIASRSAADDLRPSCGKGLPPVPGCIDYLLRERQALVQPPQNDLGRRAAGDDPVDHWVGYLAVLVVDVHVVATRGCIAPVVAVGTVCHEAEASGDIGQARDDHVAANQKLPLLSSRT